MRNDVRSWLEGFVGGLYLGDSDNHYGVRSEVASDDFTRSVPKSLVTEVERVATGEIAVADMTVLPSFMVSIGCTDYRKAMDGMVKAIKQMRFMDRAKRESMNVALIHNVGDWDVFYNRVNELNEERKCL